MKAQSGQCGDDIYWKVIDDVLYINGTGDMWDYEICSDGTFRPPRSFENCDDVIICDGVTSIGRNAFCCLYIEHIVIPESVQTIREGAFFDTNIPQLEFPSTYGKNRYSVAKTTPCLVPYKDLPEEEKAYDRNTALETLRLL